MLISMRLCLRDGSSVVEMNSFLMIPPRSPGLSPCDLFLWGYETGLVSAPPLPASIDELKQRITSTLDNVTGDMLQRVWQKLNYRLDVCYVHILNTYEIGHRINL